jgi:hypothetical protein
MGQSAAGTATPIKVRSGPRTITLAANTEVGIPLADGCATATKILAGRATIETFKPCKEAKMTDVDYPWDAIERFFEARQEVNAAMRVYIESRGLPVPEQDFFTVAYDKELAKKVMSRVVWPFRIFH